MRTSKLLPRACSASLLKMLVVAMFAMGSPILAQDAMNGTPPFGSYEFDKFDTVSLQNLNVLFSIPIASIPGRGLNTGVGLHFNQSIWRLDQDPTFQSPSGLSWQLAQGFGSLVNTFAPGWNFGQIVPYVRFTRAQGECFIRGGTASFVRTTGYVLVEPNGTTHVFPHAIISNSPGQNNNGNCPNNTTGTVTGFAADNSGFRLDVVTDGNAGLPAPPIAYTPSGLKIQSSTLNNPPILQTGSIEDVNGNFLIAVQISPNEVDWVDTLGRNVVKVTVALQNGFPTQFQYQTPNTSGGYSITTVSLQSFSLKTNFACPQGHSEGRGGGTLPTTITLANNKSYSFAYEPTPGDPSSTTGRLQTVTLPTGGTYQYAYPGPNDGVTCVPESGSTGANSFPHFDQTNSLTRTIGGAASALTENYSWVRLDANNVQTTITAAAIPADSQVATKRVFTTTRGQLPVAPFTVVDITTDQSFDFSQTNVLRTVVSTKNTQSGFPISRVTILEDGQTQSETDYSFAAGNILLSQTDYDFGTGSHGPLLRAANYTYLPGSAYAAKNLLNLAVDSTVSNSTGAVVSRSHNDYDEFQFTSCPSGVPGHDDNVLCTDLARGNVTTSTRYLDPVTPGQPIVRHRHYDWFGNLVQADVTCCTQETRSFSATTQFGYPDSITTGPSGGPQLSTRAIYDFSTGLLTTRKDENNQPTIYQYNDPLNRLTGVSYPDGGTASYAYDDTQRLVTQAKAIGNGVLPLTTVSSYDPLGQLTQTQLTSDPQGADFTAIGYDALGRTKTASNPYRSTSDPTYGVTAYSFDALGRTTKVTPPDGTTTSNNIQTTYSGNCTTVTDQVGKIRKSCSDGLGRLTQVFEPDASNNLVNETDYQYDALNNLLCVHQRGTDTTADKSCTDATVPATWRPRSFAYDSLSRLTSATNPESGTISYTYDADGNVRTKVAPAPNQAGSATVTTTFTYDALNRITQKSYSDGATATVKYGYDGVAPSGCTPPTLTITNGIGRRTSMCDAAGSEAWSYDVMGRPLTDARTTNGVTKSTSYTYNLNGSVATLAYPTGRVVTNTYNSAGQPTSAVDNVNSINFATNAVYAPHGALASVNNEPGTTTYYFYNNRLQICRISAVGEGHTTPPTSCAPSNVTTLMDLSYFYCWQNGPLNLCPSNNGNIAAIINNVYGQYHQYFTYDELNRVKTAFTQQPTNTTYGWSLSYGYDIWGNLLSQILVAGSAPQLNATVNTKNQVTNSGFVYDAAGNLTADGLNTYTYDAENRIKSSQGVTYTYDGDGKRVQKSGSKLYWYGMSSEAITRTDLAGNTPDDFVFFAGMRVTWVQPGNLPRYFHSDALGNMKKMTNGTVDLYEYYPFGGAIRITPNNNFESPYKFTGKERDSESGLDNFGARYDSSSLGRFVSPDPLGGQLVDPQTLNKYSYVANNPINFTDPTGLYKCADSAKCDSDQDVAFEKSRQNDLKSKDPNVVRGASSYGDVNTDNGTTVKFGDPGKGNDGVTTSELEIDPNNSNQMRAGETVTIRDGLSGTALDAAVAHEGSHVADAQEFVATVNIRTGGFDLSKNLFKYQREFRGYMATQSILAAANEKRIIGNCGIIDPCILGAGIMGAKVRETIDRVLANPPYNITTQNPGPRIYPALTTPPPAATPPH